jgi:hypothetical protein
MTPTSTALHIEALVAIPLLIAIATVLTKVLT